MSAFAEGATSLLYYIVINEMALTCIYVIASAVSSALLVDNAVLQNELLESEKAKQVAKQTIKIKSSGESNILQSKIMGLKSSKAAFPPENKENGSHIQGRDAIKVLMYG